MFGIDFPELVVIGVVALVVLGPERLPKAARFVGLWVRRARGQWNSVKSELERELAADEFRRTLHDTEKAMRDIDADVRAADADARREFDAMRKATTASPSDAAAATAATPAAAASHPDGLPAAATSPAATSVEPFDSLADFDPYAVEAPASVTPMAGPAAAAAAQPRPSSAFASAAAALARHQADAELSAAAVMTGPNPPASSLAHGATDEINAPDARALDVDLVALPASPPAPRPRAPLDDRAMRDGHDERSS